MISYYVCLHHLTSLSMIIPAAANGNISYFYGWVVFLCSFYICTTFSLSIPLLMDIYVTSVSWLLYSYSMNIGVHGSFQLWISPDRCPGMGFLDHMVVLLLVSGGTSILFSIVVALTYISTNSVRGFPFLLAPSPAFWCWPFWLAYDGNL